MLLTLPVMCGYGRPDKYLATPQSVKDIDYSSSDISTEMKHVVKQLHNNAIGNGYQPLRREEWETSVLGFMKSTSAAEKVRVPKSASTRSRDILKEGRSTGNNNILTGTTNAVVGIVRGDEIFNTDLERTFDTPDTCLSTGSRNVPIKATRAIYPVHSAK